jgi:hypothetical protein
MAEQEPPYSQKIYGIMKQLYGDKFTHTPESFEQKLNSDTAYVNKVYGIMREAYGNQFTHTSQSFADKLKKKGVTTQGSGQPVQQPGKPSAPSFGQKVTEKITNSASQTQVPLKTGLQVQEEKKAAEKKAKIPTSKYFEIDVEEKQDEAKAPKFADPIVVAKNSQKSKAVFNSVIGDKDIYKMPTAGESKEYATDITSGYLDYLELVGSDKSDTYKEKYKTLKAKSKADRTDQDEKFLRQVEAEAVGAFYDAKEWELGQVSSQIDNLQKTAVTDEEKAQLNDLYGQYEKKRNSLLGTSSVYAQNKLQYGKIAGTEMADEEAKLRRFEALQAGDGKTIEFFKGIGGAVANGVLSIAQVPKVFGDLVGDTDYDWSDEMYDMVSGQKSDLDREFGAPLPQGKSMTDLPFSARLAVVGGNAIGSAGLFAAGGGLVGATTNLGKAAATFGTAFLTSEAGYYQEALDAGMSPQDAALAGTYLAAQTALIESIIPDVKYFEPSAFRKSIMQGVSNGIKSGLPVKEAAKLAVKNAIKAAPESALSYGKTGIKEAGEELLGQVGEDVGKLALNAAGQRQYFNDTFNPESYTDAILGGFIAGGGMSVFSRPTAKSPIQEEVMREIVERRPQETQKGTASDKINKEDLSALDDVTEIYNAMSSHSGWNVMSREEQNHALALAQQAEVMKKEQKRMKELRIPDEKKDAEIKRLEDEVNEMFSIQLEQEKQKSKDAKVKAIEDEFNKSMEGEEFPVQEDERDQEIVELQKQREEKGVNELDTFLGDMKPMVPFAVERMEQGLPVAESVKQAASNYLYKKYKELTDMKSDPNRMMTRGQIASVQKQLEQDIRTLEGTTETKTEARDQENIQGIPSQVREGQEPVAAKPVEGPSAETPTAGGVLQAQEEVDPKKAAVEKAQKQLDGLNSQRNPKANHPIFNVGQKHSPGNNLIVINSEDRRTDTTKDGVEVITKIISPAELDENGRMTKAAEVEIGTFDSYEQGREYVNSRYDKNRAVYEERLSKANAELASPEATPTTEAAPESAPAPKPSLGKRLRTAAEAAETTVTVQEPAPVKEEKEEGVAPAPKKEKKPTKTKAKAPEIAPAPRRAGAVEASEGDNPIAGAENTLAAVGMNETSLNEWKKANEKDSQKGRIEELAELVRNLMSGKIKFKNYYEKAKQLMPSKLMDKVPAIASFKEIAGSIDRNKLEKGIVNLNKFIKKGTRVGLRIDIPAFNRFGKNVVTVHEGTGRRSPIGYGSTGSISNVTFRTSVSTAAKIGSGKSKEAFAMAEGEWLDESPESIQARAEEALNSPEWIQVGMNPTRSSFFFDKADGNPVVAADEVLQVGNLVLAKNAQKIDLNTKEGMTQFEKMFSAKTKEGVTYQYRRGSLGQRLKATFDTAGERAAEDIARFLEESGIDVQIIDSVEAERIGQERNIEGSIDGIFFADKDSGIIYLNKDSIKGKDGATIAYHEGIHPVINIIRNTNPELYGAIVAGIREEAKRNPAVARVIRQIESVKEYQKRGPEAIEDEIVVEVLAQIASGGINLNELDKTLKQKMIEFFNKLVERMPKLAAAFNLKPIKVDATSQELLAFSKKLSTALTEGGKISDVVGAENVKQFAPPPSLDIKEKENISNYEENIPIPGVIRAGQASVDIDRSTNTPIDVYQEKGVKKLPVKTLKQIYDKFKKKVVVINSDPTRVGWLTLPSGKRIFMYGGPGYLSVLDNTKGDVGFATTQESKVKSWKKYVDELFGNNPGVTLVATQAPTAILSNSYALRYVLDAISQLPKSVLESETFKSEFFGNDIALLKDAFGDKKYNEFIQKYKNSDLSNPKIIDNMISEMSYTIGDDNAPASFKARGAFVANLLGGLGEKSESKKVEGDKGYYSKKPNKYIASELMNRLGINAEKVIRDIGEPGLVDLYMNEGKWGFAVSGFETDPNMDIASIQNLGVTHPLFNAKFPGKNAFLLDGAYEIDTMFKPIEMTGPKGKPYTKRASLMLSGSMYVKGGEKQGEQTFEYRETLPSGIGVLPAVTPERITKASENLQAKFRRDGIPLSTQEAVEIVEELSSWKDWYEGIAQMVQDNFGEYAADYMMFMFGSAVAATSSATIGTALNNLERLYAKQEIAGLPIMKRNIYEILSGLPVTSDKIANFIAAGLGDKNAIPVDMHVWSFINSFPTTKKSPSKKDFDKAKEFVRAVADGLGWDPREVQAAMWAANMLRLDQRPDTYEEYIQKKIDAGLQEQIQGWRDKGYKPVFEVRQTGEKIETVFLQEEKKAEFTPKLEEVKRVISPKGQPSLIDRSLEEKVDSLISYDEDFTTVKSLVDGVKNGELLVHTRVKDGTDFEFGIEPSAGEYLRSTEAWQTAEEYYGEGPELTFFSDGLSWATSDQFKKTKKSDQMEVLFVRKNKTIQKDTGDGNAMLYDGKIVPYERSPVADFESDLFRGVPAGVERGDWYTNKAQDVAAVIDTKELSDYLAKQGQPSLIDRSKSDEEITLKDGSKVKPTKISGQTNFFHASSKKREGKLKPNMAPQWGKAVYFATSRQAATDEFGGDNVTEASFNLKKPAYTNTKEFREINEKAAELYNREMLPNILKEEAELVNGKWNFFDEDLQAEYDKNGYINRYSSSDIEEGKYFGDAAKELGYDAIIDEGGQYGTEIAVLDENAVIYPEDIESAVVLSSEDVKNSNIELKKQNIRGRLLNNQQAAELQAEIESNYTTATNVFDRSKDDIRQKMFSYDEPYVEANINGVNVRIADGLIRTDKNGKREKTYLIYADGKVAGEFYSKNDAIAVVKYIEDNLIQGLEPASTKGQLSLIDRSGNDIGPLIEEAADAVEQAIASGTSPQQALDEFIGSQEWYSDLTPAQRKQIDDILQDEFGVTPKAPKAKPTGVKAKIQNIVDNYYKLREGSKDEKRAAKAAINEILDADPKLKYIYNNISNINKELQAAGLITDKTDGCP